MFTLTVTDKSNRRNNLYTDHSHNQIFVWKIHWERHVIIYFIHSLPIHSSLFVLSVQSLTSRFQVHIVAVFIFKVCFSTFSRFHLFLCYINPFYPRSIFLLATPVNVCRLPLLIGVKRRWLFAKKILKEHFFNFTSYL